jgi:hypothetical protein
MMKTTLLTITILVCHFAGKAQNTNTINYDYGQQLLMQNGKLMPVYFNFQRRQLRDADKKIINPLEFLNLCRSIPDSAIQQQIARYDAFTKDKARLGVVALGGGFAAIGLLGTTAAVSEQGNDAITGSFAFLGVVALLAIPAAAIYSSVPHQKRKAVLFKDLPIVYNYYVLSHS